MLYKINKLNENREVESSYITSDNKDAEVKSFDDDYEVEIIEDDGTAFKENTVVIDNEETH